MYSGVNDRLLDMSTSFQQDPWPHYLGVHSNWGGSTNHTDKPEYLQGANADGGQWINAPQHILYPGATETITATAPFTNHLDVNAIYRIGAFGPTANYQLTNHPHNVNTAMSSIWGPHAQNYWMNNHIDTGYPQVNVGFDQW